MRRNIGLESLQPFLLLVLNVCDTIASITWLTSEKECDKNGKYMNMQTSLGNPSVNEVCLSPWFGGLTTYGRVSMDLCQAAFEAISC